MKGLWDIIIKHVSPQLSYILVASGAAIFIGAEINGAVQSITEEIKHNRTVILRMEETQQQIGEISDNQRLIIMYVSDISEIQKKSADEIVKMIKEAAKTPVNMPLIERIGEDVRELNEGLPNADIPLPPSKGERQDSVKIGVRRRQ
ncbi:MAG: hypothetical protein LBV41_04800 [Cytophagaceae bacterium]|jgi:hypothetical protein|nr:hypothetical protein [Cytophagaceae bacterium]